MKKFVLFLIILLLITVNLFAQAPQHYNYDTAGINNNFPFNVQGGKQVQWLIRAGEFNKPSPIPSGTSITAVYFFMGGTAAKQLWHLNVSLGQTSLTSLPAGDIYRGPLTTVYYRTNDELTSIAGTWMRIILDTPFPYDTSLSLVIDVSQCASSGSGSMTVKQTVLNGIRRNANNFALLCDYSISYQDSSAANCGVDVVSNPVCSYNWAEQNSGTTNSLISVKAVNSLIGWTAGEGGTIRRTTNGGLTWMNGNPNPGVITGEICMIEATNADTAFCATKLSSAAFVFRTTDGGFNWTQTWSQSGCSVKVIHFTSLKHGYFISDTTGGNWSVWYTYDCGSFWYVTRTILQNGNEHGWNNSMVFTGNFAWFGTNNSKIYKAYNPVCDWISSATPGLVNSMSVHFNSNTLGLAGGNTLMKSTDGGLNWFNLNPVPVGGNIPGIEGTGNDFWYIRGTGIYRSSNSGEGWSLCYSGADTLYDIDFAVVNGCPKGWAVGSGGKIVRMNTDSLISVSINKNQIPKEFQLCQNYPNPFNPVTRIKFSIPLLKGMFSEWGVPVKLVIYDMLGREIAVLADKKFMPGIYEIEWDASDYPSGIYFYKLTAPQTGSLTGEFAETRKMVLLK